MAAGDWDDDDAWDTGPGEVAPAAALHRHHVYLIVIVGDNVGEMHELRDGDTVIGRGRRAKIALHDDGVSRAHARVRREGNALMIEDLGSRNGTFVNGRRIHAPSPLFEGDKIQLGTRTMLRATMQDTFDERFQRQLVEAAMFDALTRAHSRGYFQDRLEAELRFAERHGTPLALVLLDLDHLKQVNDQYGHAAGDRVLVEVARAVHEHVRAEDLFGRLGGDEFGILCRSTPLAVAATFAERLRTLVAELTVSIAGATLPVTVTVGVAAFPDVACRTGSDLVEAADRALYLAKMQGRNRVALHPEETEETRDVVQLRQKAAESEVRDDTGDTGDPR